ncbi:MAG: hypothetical protein ACYDCQ_01265 [Dehalococcoidia bacterium]
MTVLRRLFGKRESGSGSESATAPRPEPPPLAAVATAAEPGAEVLDLPASANAADDVAIPAQSELPLKSLSTYQRDPGYKNFLAKMKRPPGVQPRRPSGPDGLYPPKPPR